MEIEWKDSLMLHVPSWTASIVSSWGGPMPSSPRCVPGEVRAEIGDLFGYLRSYVGTHFAAEEALMRDRGYPGFEQHIQEHALTPVTFTRCTTASSRKGRRRPSSSR